MMKVGLCLAILLQGAGLTTLPACASQTTPQAAKVTTVFSAHGGVGRSDSPRPYYAVVVVDIDLPVAAQSMLGVSEFALADASADKASLKAVENIVELAVAPPSTLVATYLKPPGIAVTQPLRAGLTRVRIRVRLDVPSGGVTRYRMTLSGLGPPIVVTGPAGPEWPT